MNSKTVLMAAVAVLLSACVQVTTDAPKPAPEMPGTLQPADKGDWRTRYYTDVRGEVHMNDTRFDSYEPIYPNYYSGYEFDAEAGDTIDVRVGAADLGFDAVIGIYGPQAPNGEWGALRASNDDSPEGGTYDSYIRLEVARSGKYLILVRDYSWEPGELWASVTCEGGPCEDNVCDYDVFCALYCEHGHQRDENGCEVCACEGDPVCPSVQPPPYVRCAGIVTWGKNPDTGDCCQYPSPCNVPPDFEQFGTEAECQGPAGEGEACSMYGRQCADDLECEYVCPDGSTDGNCNLGINPSGTCVAAALCNEGESRAADDGCNTCTCSGGQWACTEIACAPAECVTDSDCVVTGCSGQICASDHMVSTCEWREEYACYRTPTTSCGCNDGQCGWANTPELDACLNN